MNISFSMGRGAPIYPSEFTPLLQVLLSTLADIDFAYECDAEVVRSSAADEAIKYRVLAKLAQQHEEKREPYLRQIAALEDRIAELFAETPRRLDETEEPPHGDYKGA
jgi:hypothetical protein